MRGPEGGESASLMPAHGLTAAADAAGMQRMIEVHLQAAALLAGFAFAAAASEGAIGGADHGRVSVFNKQLSATGSSSAKNNLVQIQSIQNTSIPGPAAVDQALFTTLCLATISLLERPPFHVLRYGPLHAGRQTVLLRLRRQSRC